MNIEEIRAKAPEGATHYREFKIIERTMYYKKLSGVIYWFNDCDRWSSVLKDDGLEYMQKLRSKLKPL